MQNRTQYFHIANIRYYIQILTYILKFKYLDYAYKKNYFQRDVEDIAILSCDTMTDAQFEPILEEHIKQGAALTMLTSNLNPNFVNPKPPGYKIKNVASKFT